MKTYLYVANWKMYLSLDDSCSLIERHAQELAQLSAHGDIVICPSYVALGKLAGRKKYVFSWGAQDCSYEASGAYTGDINAQTLKQAECTFCIVGHSERREYYGETDIQVAQKVTQLFECGITPIVCIGETAKDRLSENYFEVLQSQLLPIIDICSRHNSPIVFAYEPIWAIGKEVIPDQNDIFEATNFIKSLVHNTLPHLPARFLYGGNVSAETISSLKTISILDGFLIGRASCDFQTFKKIVL